jgi:Holliday junction resolvase RusA-like endonuclease
MTHTPKETAVYENLIRLEYERQCGNQRFEDNDMLDLRILAYYAIPKSASMKKKKAMEDGVVRPAKKRDADNVLKVVADSLNQLAYRDDAQIVDTQIRKYYSHKPRLEVMIQNVATAGT